MTWAIDLDGVVWRGAEAIAGSPQALRRLQEEGQDPYFVTNSSAHATSVYLEKLAKFGVDVAADHLIHAGHALTKIIAPGERVLLCAGDGAREALTAHGVEVVEVDSPQIGAVDAVVLGWTTGTELQTLSLAAQHVLNGARLVATNLDPLYPNPAGVSLGTGSMAAAVAYASGTEATFAGKPSVAMANLVSDWVGPGAVSVFVGDQPNTDGRLAEMLGARFALVETGVARLVEGRGSEVPVHGQYADLAAATKALLGAD